LGGQLLFLPLKIKQYQKQVLYGLAWLLLTIDGRIPLYRLCGEYLQKLSIPLKIN